MLEIFRNKKNSVFLLGILGIIVLGFVFFGIPTGGGAKNYVAMVDGDKVSLVNELPKTLQAAGQLPERPDGRSFLRRPDR